MINSGLVIDDERDFLTSVRRALVASGLKNVTLLNDPGKLMDVLKQNTAFDVAVIDITMPFMDGGEVLSIIKRESPFTECIMVTARNEARLAVECLRRGAYDYIVKPIGADDFIRVVQHALEKKRLLEIVELTKEPRYVEPLESPAFGSIVTVSPKIRSILKEAELHAQSDVPILILGETGTGKELLARAIHQASSRANQTFTPINMASLSENLFESAFFGHVKGAFTGAHSDHAGFLEATDNGTLFLDEIGILPLKLQGNLLRVLQEKEFVKVGVSKPRPVDIRFVAATNADLHALMANGSFRQDIYYRLRGAQLHLPALRERKEDIPVLIASFLKEYCPPNAIPDVTDEAIAMLVSYDYPGNIRELKSVVQAAVNLSRGQSITPSMLPFDILKQKKQLPSQELCLAPRTTPSLADLEKVHITKIMAETGGNLTHTAKLLGICLNTLRKKLTTYGIHRK